MLENVIFSLITAFTLTYLVLPSIIHVARSKNLMPEPKARDSHKEQTPSLGGVGIFAGVVCLVHPAVAFTRPWPMGIVFFVGEWAGGLVLYLEDHRCAAVPAQRDTGDDAQ